MHSGEFNRPINLALGGSLAVHALLGLGLLLWLAGILQPSVNERMLVLTLQAAQRDDAVAIATAATAPTARASQRQAAQSPDQAGLKNRRVTRLDPTPPPVRPLATEIRTPPEPQQAAETARFSNPMPTVTATSDPPSDAESPVAAEAATETVITTVAAARARAAPETITNHPLEAKAPIEVRQRRMLGKRIRHWEQNLHKLFAQGSVQRWSHKGQAFEARFERFPARGDTDLETVSVEVITEKDGKLLRTEMQMKMLAFSHFAQFVHRWDPAVQVHDDTFDGRFHSNSKFTLAWDRHAQPRFLGKVTTASRHISYGDTRGQRRHNEIFQGGLETGVRSIPLARRYSPPTVTNSDVSQQIIRIGADSRLTFYADGSMRQQSADGSQLRHHQLSGDTVYLLADPGVTLRVSGKVSGRILVYSPERIVIENDITYTHDMGAGTSNQTFLGLVAGKNVEIAEPQVTGPGPLYIHASIYAKREFKVRKFRHPENSVLYIYGSVTAGTISATEPRYATHIEFDKRLELSRPPGFPVTDRYELAAWDHQWSPVTSGIHKDSASPATSQ